MWTRDLLALTLCDKHLSIKVTTFGTSRNCIAAIYQRRTRWVLCLGFFSWIQEVRRTADGLEEEEEKRIDVVLRSAKNISRCMLHRHMNLSILLPLIRLPNRSRLLCRSNSNVNFHISLCVNTREEENKQFPCMAHRQSLSLVQISHLP